MTDAQEIKLHELLGPLFPEAGKLRPKDWDYGFLDYNPDARQRVIEAIREIADAIKPNIVIGYDGHNLPFGVATEMGIACATAYKKTDRKGIMTPGYIPEYLDASQANLGEDLHFIHIDDCAEKGEAASKLVQFLQYNGYDINNVIILVENEGKGAREILAKMNVKLHSLIRYSDEKGFQPGISGAEADAFVKTFASGSAKSALPPDAVSQDFKRIAPEISILPIFRHTREHKWRPGGTYYNWII